MQGCKLTVKTNGLCSKHNERLRRHGNPAYINPKYDREKTRCVNGHSSYEENLKWFGSKKCITCASEATRRWRLKKIKS